MSRDEFQRRSDRPDPVFIVGPTAVGKSASAIVLAGRIGGEIISVDSMQVYRGLDVGTAKPSLAERARVPHHLIDVVELDEAFDAAKFCRLAGAAAEEIRDRGHVSIFCGGTGLYFKAHLEGLGESPAADAKVRAELESSPLPALLEELKERDPNTFEKIDRQNSRRIVRALEVIRLTGRPFSTQRAAWSGSPSSATVAGLLRAPEDLRRRIDRRVDEMFRCGFVAETEALLKSGLAANRTAMQAIGYRQVVEHVGGVRSLSETIELVKIRTRQFARRQMTWFRRQLPVHWLPVEPAETPETTASRIAVECLKPPAF